MGYLGFRLAFSFIVSCFSLVIPAMYGDEGSVYLATWIMTFVFSFGFISVMRVCSSDYQKNYK
jgi:hypothetical protein